MCIRCGCWGVVCSVIVEVNGCEPVVYVVDGVLKVVEVVDEAAAGAFVCSVGAKA